MPVSAQLDGRKRAEDDVVRFLGQPVLQRHLLRAAQQVAADERAQLLLPPLPLQVIQGRRLPPSCLLSPMQGRRLPQNCLSLPLRSAYARHNEDSCRQRPGTARSGLPPPLPLPVVQGSEPQAARLPQQRRLLFLLHTQALGEQQPLQLAGACHTSRGLSSAAHAASPHDGAGPWGCRRGRAPNHFELPVVGAAFLPLQNRVDVVALELVVLAQLPRHHPAPGPARITPRFVFTKGPRAPL